MQNQICDFLLIFILSYILEIMIKKYPHTSPSCFNFKVASQSEPMNDHTQNTNNNNVIVV